MFDKKRRANKSVKKMENNAEDTKNCPIHNNDSSSSDESDKNCEPSKNSYIKDDNDLSKDEKSETLDIFRNILMLNTNQQAYLYKRLKFELESVDSLPVDGRLVDKTIIRNQTKDSNGKISGKVVVKEKFK